MARPVVGVIANAHLVEKRFSMQAVGDRTLRAVANHEVMDIPILLGLCEMRSILKRRKDDPREGSRPLSWRMRAPYVRMVRYAWSGLRQYVRDCA